MTSLLTEKWLWAIILALIVIIIGPILIIWAILALPGEIKLVVTILIVVGWGVAAGYRDWLKERRQREEENHHSSGS